MTWTLTEAILSNIKVCHTGRSRARKRKDLLAWLYNLGLITEISESIDREVRAIIETYPEICSCEDGYFYDGGPEDVEYSIQYLMKKIMPLFKKIKARKLAYPEYYPDPDQLKLEL